jgi:hypothetical protein
MKRGVYTVRGTIGPDKSEPVNVSVMSLAADPSLRMHYDTSGRVHGDCAAFHFRGLDFVFVPRPRSPYPERLKPQKCPLDLQSTARSIAVAAFKAAIEAAEQDALESDIAAREAEQEGLNIDDIALRGVAGRRMGVAR